jgi:membrane protein YqaA with SNARE-associated domain
MISLAILFLHKKQVGDLFWSIFSLFVHFKEASFLVVFSFLEFPIPNDVAFIGEIGLGGELRTVSFLLLHCLLYP